MIVHYGPMWHRPSKGALCGAPSGSLTLSTSWSMVTCDACFVAARLPDFRDGRPALHPLEQAQRDGFPDVYNS